MEKKQPANSVSIGKFDIFATYTYAHALLNGMDDDDAEQRGMVAAIMGAQARLGIRKEHKEEFQAQKEAAEKKKKTTITAESFDKQVAHKMGEFFNEDFLPMMKKLVEAAKSYDEVKGLVKIPSTWGTPRGSGAIYTTSGGLDRPVSSRIHTGLGSQRMWLAI
jgi:hypothetical protein